MIRDTGKTLLGCRLYTDDRLPDRGFYFINRKILEEAMSDKPEPTVCPGCGKRAFWAKDHWHCGYCGEDIWPVESEDEL